jgi:hypothetical protein
MPCLKQNNRAVARRGIGMDRRTVRDRLKRPAEPYAPRQEPRRKAVTVRGQVRSFGGALSRRLLGMQRSPDRFGG